MSRKRTIGTGKRASGVRGIAALAVAVLLGAGWMLGRAGDNQVFEAGGGDTVGSLPLMSAPPPPEGGGPGPGSTIHALWGPEKPIVTLTGTPDEVFDSILDAAPMDPDSVCVMSWIDDEHVQLAFYGRVKVLIDRTAVQSGAVRSDLLVGASFAGGIAQIRVGGVLRTTNLLAPGTVDFRLKGLDQAGALTQGVSWHAISPEGKHRIVSAQAAANVIELSQRD